MAKEFKNKNLNRELIFSCLKDFGAENLLSEPKNHLKGTYNGKEFHLNVFHNKNGATTIGYSPGFDRDLFELLAEEIVRCCSYANGQRLELSLSESHIKKKDFDGLLEFLRSEGATIMHEDKSQSYETYHARWQGPNGDTLTIKSFINGTVQFQGKHLHLASLVWDYLYNVLSLADVILKQSKTYKINVTVDEIKSELEGKIPISHQFLEDTVRKQLSSALMLYKISMPLEDYSAVAFPALRGLEGFIKQIILKSGLNPTDKSNIGEYFKQEVVGKYVLLKVNADHVGDTFSNILAKSYNFYVKQRHGIFHMDTSVETSRILGSIEDARRIIDDVFEIIEDASRKLHS